MENGRLITSEWNLWDCWISGDDGDEDEDDGQTECKLNKQQFILHDWWWHNDINFSCTPCEEDQVLCRPRPGCSCTDSNQDGFFVEETGAMAQNEGFYSISLLFSWGKRGSENPGMTSEFGWGYFWKERFLIPMAIRWASPSAVAFWFTANLPEEVGVRRWVWKLHIRSSCRWWRWPRLRYGAEKMETCKGLNLRSNNLGSNFCKCQLRIGSGKRICVGVSSCWGLISDIVRGIWTSHLHWLSEMVVCCGDIFQASGPMVVVCCSQGLTAPWPGLYPVYDLPRHIGLHFVGTKAAKSLGRSWKWIRIPKKWPFLAGYLRLTIWWLLPIPIFDSSDLYSLTLKFFKQICLKTGYLIPSP